MTEPPSKTTPGLSFDSSSLSSTLSGVASSDHDLDTLFGATYCACFILGFLGNITSFCYFITRKTDLPNTLYRIITMVDAIISAATLIVGITMLSNRVPGNYLANNSYFNNSGCFNLLYSKIDIFEYKQV